jgi:hypothetical protein
MTMGGGGHPELSCLSQASSSGVTALDMAITTLPLPHQHVCPHAVILGPEANDLS